MQLQKSLYKRIYTNTNGGVCGITLEKGKEYILVGKLLLLMFVFLGRESKKNRVVLKKYSILVFQRFLYTLYSLSIGLKVICNKGIVFEATS